MPSPVPFPMPLPVPFPNPFRPKSVPFPRPSSPPKPRPTAPPPHRRVPAKEKTIARFLKGKFAVRSSFGHVRDLPPKKIGVEVDNDFAPQYVVLPRAKKILDDFKHIAAKCSTVYLATDHDREGESIAWHIVDILKLPLEKVRRITFHEITPEAINKAVSEPRAIDEHLVQAQQARRIIDRLVGYRLSPLLWEKSSGACRPAACSRSPSASCPSATGKSRNSPPRSIGPWPPRFSFPERRLLSRPA